MRLKPDKSKGNRYQIRKIRTYFYITLLTVSGVGLWYLPRKIIIKHIECTSQNGKCSQRIESGIRQFTGMPLPVSKKRVRDFLTHELVSKDMTIRYQYPSNLEVSVIETKPVFAVTDRNGNIFRLVDKAGSVLSESSETNLPYAVESDLPDIGTKLNEKEVFALNILLDLSRSYEISKGELSDNGLLVELPTKTKVLFPLEGDRDLILGSFVLIINQLNTVKTSSTMEKVVLAGKTLDLRYKNPVIR